MKPEEAISAIKNNMPTKGTYTILTEALEVAIQALEKQVPKKPVDTCNTPPVDLVYCPVCFNSLTDTYGWEYEYCPECGQAIDWTEELE